jgi:hypothetical protein
MTSGSKQGPEKRPRASRVSKAAYVLVDERADEIADALMKAAKEGKVMSMMLLLKLADMEAQAREAKGKSRKAGPLRSLALRLAKELEENAVRPNTPTEMKATIRAVPEHM